MSTPFEVIVDTPSTRLEPDALLQRMPVDGVGAVVSFVGLTRGTEGDAKVLRLSSTHGKSSCRRCFTTLRCKPAKRTAFGPWPSRTAWQRGA